MNNKGIFYLAEQRAEYKMKRLIFLILILLAVSTGIFAQVNGELTQVNNKWILQTWGTHQERGYAHGYLLTQPILQIYHNYIYQIVAMNNPTIYNAVVSFYLNSFVVEPKYQQEAQGIINGMQAAGANLYMPELGRNLNKDDILTYNCIVDIIPYFSNINAIGGQGIYCSSLSSWGTSTQADSLLNGGVVISRLLDWDMDGNLVANPLLMISHPSEPDEQKWISFTYPGLIGPLSGISESGKSAFLNMGNVHDFTVTTGLHPVLLSIRNAIEQDDYNNDGTDNITDVYDAVDAGLSLSGTIVHAVSENPAVMTGIIENNNTGVMLRTMQHNDNYPAGMHLIATNHFRLLSGIVCCSRYARIVDSLAIYPNLSAKKQLAILKGAAGLDNNMMVIQYIPGSGEILWGTATPTNPAHVNEMLPLNRNTLFAFSTLAEDDIQMPFLSRLLVYPNPARLNTSVQIRSSVKTQASLEVFNLNGQKIATIKSDGNAYTWNKKDDQGKFVSSGIYLFRLKDNEITSATAKVLLLK